MGERPVSPAKMDEEGGQYHLRGREWNIDW
ncbi:hypothetical protein EMIT0P12_10993 [Pseudomonas sp. IT-P12]